MKSVSSNRLWQLCQKVFSNSVCKSKRGDDISLSFLECDYFKSTYPWANNLSGELKDRSRE